MIPKPTPRPKVRKPLRSKPTGISPTLREAVFARDNWTCQWCRVPGGRLDAHHRLRRSKGGKDTLQTLTSCHRICHDYIHTHPEEARKRGFLVRSEDEL